MRRALFIVLGVAQLVFLAIAAERPAFAYADPGSGLLFIQVASSMVAGALFIVRSRLRRMFGWRKGRAGQVAGEDAPETQK